MNILLVSPKSNHPTGYEESPSRALLILGTLARQHGHKVKIVHQEIDPLPEGSFDIVGITCNTFKVKHAKEIADKYKDSHVVIGGPHAEYYDGFCNTKVVGEGENAWLGILGATGAIGSIDDIPIPDYSLVDLKRFPGISPVGNFPAAAMMCSRGCIGQCTFCNTPVFWGKKVRYRSPELIFEEVSQLYKDYGVREIFFQDDTFNINHRWAFQIFEKLIASGLNKQMTFKIACRVNQEILTEEFLDMASRAGVWNIFYGVESGSQKMLDSMKKNVTIEEVKRAIKLTHKYGIKAQCSFIMGLPGETVKTIRETRNLIEDIRADMIGIGFAIPFPGTELDRIVTERGHKRQMPYDEYGYGKLMCRTDVLDYPYFERSVRKGEHA